MLKIAINTIAVGAAFGATAYAGPEGMPGNISVPVILAQVTPEKPAPVNPAPSTSASPFDAGLADRRAYEEWFASLTGDFKRGVEYWAGQRSLKQPGSCYLADGTSAGEWTKGCVAAQRQFAPSDVRRKAEPDYRQGWNAYSPPVTPPPVATATPPAAEPSRAYVEGLADRQAWEHYFGTMSGPEKEGAEWWASHRSDPNNPSCFALTAEQYQNPKVGEVITGCLSAKLQLDPTDKRRLAEPDYREGWRSYALQTAGDPVPAASAPASPSPAVASQPVVNAAPAVAAENCTVKQIITILENRNTALANRTINDFPDCNLSELDRPVIWGFRSHLIVMNKMCALRASIPNSPRPIECDKAAIINSIPLELVARAVVELNPQTKQCILIAVNGSLPDPADRCGVADDKRALAYGAAFAIR
jgi:hypothetical protein